MKISLIQYSPAWEDKQKNIAKLKNILNAECMNSLIILPEMTLTAFTMESSLAAEELKGESYNFYASIAVEYNAHIAAGIIERQGDRFYNSLLHIQPDGTLKAVYRKIHPFSYSSENKHYTAGTKPVLTEIEGWKTGLSICYDLRFPELYRMYAKERAALLINIANWPDTRIEHWRALLKARAIENQCYVAGVNRVGKDPKLNYDGYSSLFDPMGKELLTMANDEGILQADINPDYVQDVRNKLPFLNDMVLL